MSSRNREDRLNFTKAKDASTGSSRPIIAPMASPPERLGAWLVLLVLLVLAAGWNLAPPPPEWVERFYSRGLYRWVAAVLVPLAEAAPFSVSAWAVALVILAGPALLLLAWKRKRRRGWSRAAAALWELKALAFASAAAYLVFLALWGAGYRRQPLEERLRLGGGAATAEEMKSFLTLLRRVIERDLPLAPDRDGPRALAALRQALLETIKSWDGRPVPLPRRIKHPPPGFFLAFGTAGMLSPFFLEPHVDPALPEVAALATSAHELAHVAGLSGEADADFAAAAAGLRARDAYARYAVALSLFRSFTAELPPAERRQFLSSLPPAARGDLAEMRRVSERYRVERLVKLQGPVYDIYLKSQGVKHGVKDYSRALQLVIKARRQGQLKIFGGND
ncbi:MAG: DUF3810 family protein [Planctomycetes bacterium]|nr:DUF3810 family protein [Planctomycetota bacterium]